MPRSAEEWWTIACGQGNGSEARGHAKLSDALAMADALYACWYPFRLLLFEGGDHGLSEYRARRPSMLHANSRILVCATETRGRAWSRTGNSDGQQTAVSRQITIPPCAGCTSCTPSHHRGRAHPAASRSSGGRGWRRGAPLRRQLTWIIARRDDRMLVGALGAVRPTDPPGNALQLDDPRMANNTVRE